MFCSVSGSVFRTFRHSLSGSPKNALARGLNTLSLAVICIALGLSGCGGTVPIQPGAAAPAPTTSAKESMADIKPLLEKAQHSPSPQREGYYLEAAELLTKQGQYDWARNLLNNIDSDRLDDVAFVRYTVLFGGLAMQDNAYFLAQRILTNPRLEQQWQALPAPAAITLRQYRADLFGLLGESLISVRERLVLSDLLPPGEADEQNQDAIWQTLMTLPLEQLQDLGRSEQDPLLKGWYTLAALSKNNQTDLDRQLAQVDQWIARWPDHPASMRLPNDLQLLRQLINERPMRVAMLLPSQGKWDQAGKAIRDGFFAAYYQANLHQSQTPEIRLYDTSEGDINAIYDRAVAEGAEMVIGPLDKDNVTVLNQREALPVPTLALNNLEMAGDLETPPAFAAGLYQFGLAIEDEARQAARRAWVEGHRQAMILVPDNARGERGAAAFAHEWQTLGGIVVGESRFSEQGSYSEVIKNGLHVQESYERAKRLRERFGHLEFEPRRRQDVDMLFLIASPTEARQIKPTLAFHYAGEIPVYATSHIYTGVEDSKSDRDLQGIKFSTLPWVFDTASPEKQAVKKYAKPPAVYHSLYAMGVDAYRLYPRLKQLELVPQTRFYGATGALRLLANRRIEREQMWAQIRSGRARPLPMVASDTQVE